LPPESLTPVSNLLLVSLIPVANLPPVLLLQLASRVSFETNFDSKQPKLEPKLVSALSETKRLFRLFRFYTETESFDVSIELKQTEDQPKQFLRFGGSATLFIYFVFYSHIHS
jgi:hypothetical protein